MKFDYLDYYQKKIIKNKKIRWKKKEKKITRLSAI